MKKFFKIILIFILILIIAAAGYFVYIKYIANAGDRDAFNAVPEDAIFIVETTNLSKAWTTISESELWQHLASTPYFSDVNSDIEMLDDFLKANAIADAFLNDRKLIMSAHMTSGVNWDFLFVVDLQEGAETVKSLTSALGMIEGYELTTSEYKAENELFSNQIYLLTNSTNASDKTYICLLDNLILISFTGSLIERSLNQKNDKHWDNNKNFQTVMTEMNSRKLFKFYFNFNMLDDFSKTFLTEEDEIVTMFSKSLNFSIFDFDLKNNKLSFEGIAKLDTINSYISALAKVEPGKIRAHEIMTDQAAIYFSIAFSDYITFYQSLLDEYAAGSPADYTEIQDGIELVEKLLKINMNDDFFSWIGNEIALFKIRPMSEAEREEDIVIAINANDIDNAKTGLNHITEQIRKRTGVKFDIINYKNYEINYLSEKGLIKLIFGKLFDRIEKPYFTYIEDYVVMSNSQDILLKVIDDYISGKTLSHNKSFVSFKDEFEVKSNISLFIQMPKVYTLLYHYTPKENLESFLENKDMLLSFARIGFQLTSSDNKFKTKIMADYDEEALFDDDLEVIASDAGNELSNIGFEELNFKVILSEDSLKNNGSFTTYYPETTTVYHEGLISGNNLNGLCRSYYESGNIKSSVNYKDGKVDGIAYFYYDDEVSTVLAEVKFLEDKIIDYYQEFYDNGAQKAKVEYKDGIADGAVEFYYKTGKIKIEGKYKKGEKDGKWKFYDENGELMSKEKWNDGDVK